MTLLFKVRYKNIASLMRISIWQMNFMTVAKQNIITYYKFPTILHQFSVSHQCFNRVPVKIEKPPVSRASILLDNC